MATDPSQVARPRFEVPGVLPLAPALLMRTADTVLAVTHLDVYRGGLGFRLTVAVREGFQRAGVDLGRHIVFARAAHGREPLRRPEVLRIVVRFADGRETSNVDDRPPDDEQAWSGPVLSLDGGGRTRGNEFGLGQWLWPLPPSGPLTLTFDWPARGIDHLSHQVDGRALRAAAEQSVVLWPEGSRA